MTQKEIRIGIVGADTKAGCARVAHVSAINGLPGLKLAAVVTRNEQSAREAAEAFEADRWYSDPFAMIGKGSSRTPPLGAMECARKIAAAGINVVLVAGREELLAEVGRSLAKGV